jgi:hypothetical protein
MAHVLTITGRIPSKKNSVQMYCRNNIPFKFPSNQHRAWLKDAKDQLGIQAQPGVKLFKGAIVLKLFAPDRRAGDLTNKAESVMDLLVECGHIEDDNWFVVPELKLLFGGVDKENPRVEIYDEE